MDKVKIAKSLIKLAKELIHADIERKYYIEGKKEDARLFVRVHKDDWKNFGKSPEWKEITMAINEECQGNFYGVDHSCFKKDKDDYEVGVLLFNGTNDKDHKSPVAMFHNNFKKINFIEEKF